MPDRGLRRDMDVIRLDRTMRREHPQFWAGVLLDLVCVGGMAVGFLFGEVIPGTVLQRMSDVTPEWSVGAVLALVWVGLLVGWVAVPYLFRVALIAGSAVVSYVTLMTLWGSIDQWQATRTVTLGWAHLFVYAHLAVSLRIQAREPRQNPVSEASRVR